MGPARPAPGHLEAALIGPEQGVHGCDSERLEARDALNVRALLLCLR